MARRYKSQANLPKQKAPSYDEALCLAGPTGFEPAISSVTGRRVRPATPRARISWILYKEQMRSYQEQGQKATAGCIIIFMNSNKPDLPPDDQPGPDIDDIDREHMQLNAEEAGMDALRSFRSDGSEMDEATDERVREKVFGPEDPEEEQAGRDLLKGFREGEATPSPDMETRMRKHIEEITGATFHDPDPADEAEPEE
jgi:hypothetical protein